MRIIPVKASGVAHEREGITFSLYCPAGLGRKTLREVVEKIGHKGLLVWRRLPG